MIVDKINQYLAESGKTFEESIAYEVGLLAQWSFKRQFMEENEGVTKGRIRLSACGKCPRQNAYAYHGFEAKGKTIDARAKFTFFAGDVCEIAIVQVAKTALKKLGGGCLTGTGREQITIKLPVNGDFIEGHPDGLFLADKKILLLECKSFSSFAFKRFEMGQIDDSYLAQINAYMSALGLESCVMVGYSKDSNVLHEIVLDRNEEIVQKVRENLKSILHSTSENLPAPQFTADEKGFLPWNCLYCNYWGTCKPTAEKVLVKNSYKLKEPIDDRLRNENEGSNSGNIEVGSAVRRDESTGKQPRRSKKDGTVGTNAQM